MTVVKTVVVSVVKRAWGDLEPKLIAFLTTGLTATVLITGADYVGIHLDPSLAALIVLVVGGFAGYVKASTSKQQLDPTVPVGAPTVTPFTSSNSGRVTITGNTQFVTDSNGGLPSVAISAPVETVAPVAPVEAPVAPVAVV